MRDLFSKQNCQVNDDEQKMKPAIHASVVVLVGLSLLHFQ